MSYFLNRDMGKVLDLEEGHPVEVHKALIKKIKAPFLQLAQDFPILGKKFKPSVQINTGNFYFRDPEILEQILNEYIKQGIYPSIHQKNNAQPLNESEEFLVEICENIERTRGIWGNHICVHLPVNDRNDIKEVIENLTKRDLVELLEENRHVSIDLENNHHNSFFGNLYNCSVFIEQLDKELQEKGLEELKSQFNFTFDYGHFFTQSHFMNYDKRKMLADFFRSNGNRIKTLHLHVNDGIHKDQHIMPRLCAKKRENGKFYVGGKEVDLLLLQEHEKILLESLPILDWKNKKNSNLVIEIDSIYTDQDLVNCVNLLYTNL